MTWAVAIQWIGWNSFAPGKFEWNFRYEIFKQILVIYGWGISCEIALIWMSLDFVDDRSTLVQVMAWRRQATSHYLSQCWPRSLSPYGVTRPQWVNSNSLRKSVLSEICLKNSDLLKSSLTLAFFSVVQSLIKFYTKHDSYTISLYANFKISSGRWQPLPCLVQKGRTTVKYSSNSNIFLFCRPYDKSSIHPSHAIYASINCVIIGSGNDSSPVRHHAITWTNASILSIGLLGTYFNEIWIGILSFSYKKKQLKMSSAKMAAIFVQGEMS